MNRRETIYSAVSGIRSEYIEQAADYRFSRKRSFLRIGSAVAAACVVLCAGALGLRYMLQEGQIRKGADLASGAQPATAAYEEAAAEEDLSAAGLMAVPEQEFPMAEKAKAASTASANAAGSASLRKPIMAEEAYAPDEMAPNRGEARIAPGLLATLEEDNGSSGPYAVELNVFFYGGLWETYLDEAHERYMECWEDPAVQRYESLYEDWRANIYVPDELDLAMLEKGADISPERFAEYWNETASEEDRAAYAEASGRRQRAWDAYLDRVADSETEEALRAEDRERERQRLSEAGIEVVYDEESHCFRGDLTRDQILHFPCSPSFGYQINWTNHDSIADE